MYRSLAFGVLVLLCFGTAQAQDGPQAALPAWKYEQSFALPDVPEPSGLCWCGPRNSFFIVDDGAEDRPASLSEINDKGDMLQNLPLGYDLEGVCFCPADGLVYVADENEERLYSVDPDGLKLRTTYRIDRWKDGQELLQAGGNGIEGLEYIPAGHGPWSDCFLLLNQDDPHMLLAVKRSSLRAESDGLTESCGHWDVAAINAGSLHFDAATDTLWVVHSWMNVMELWDINDMSLRGWEVVPGAAQEAVCLDGSGRLWIGSDSGGIASYTPSEI